MLALVFCLMTLSSLVGVESPAQAREKGAPEKKRQVTGVVVDHAGKPLAGVALYLIGVDPEGEPGLVKYEPDGHTDAEGRFLLGAEGTSVQSGQQLSIGLKRPRDEMVKTLRSPTGDFPRIESWKIEPGIPLDLGQLAPPVEKKRARQVQGRLVEVLMMQSANIAFRSGTGPAKAASKGKPYPVLVVQVEDLEYGGKCAFSSQSPYREADWRAGEEVRIRFDATFTRFWLTNRKGVATPTCAISFEGKAPKPSPAK